LNRSRDLIFPKSSSVEFPISIHKKAEMAPFSSFNFSLKNIQEKRFWLYGLPPNEQIVRKFTNAFNILPFLLCCVFEAEFLQYY